MNSPAPQIVPWRKRQPTIIAPTTLQRRVVDRMIMLHGVYARAGIHFPMPTISFDLEGKAAGVAIQYRHIRFNSDILIEHTQAFLDQIVGHELAHIAAAYIHRNKTKLAGHGIEWKVMMKIIGQEPHVRHDLLTPKMDAKFLHGYCDCNSADPSIRMTDSKRKRFLLRYNHYYCKACKQTIYPSLEAKIAAKVALEQLLTPNPMKTPQNLATPSQIKYAKQLAIQKDVTPDPQLFCDKIALSEWIQHAKELNDVTPTPTQINLIKTICLSKKQALPDQPLKYKRAASAWLNQHK